MGTHGLGRLAPNPNSFIVGAALLAFICTSGRAIGQEIQFGGPLDPVVEPMELTPPSGISAIEPIDDDAPASDDIESAASEPAPLNEDAGILDSTAPIDLDNDPVAAAVDGKNTVETIRERYANRKVKIERQVTQDKQGNYVNHGTWRMWDEQGNLVAEGQYDMGERSGQWSRWHRRIDSKLFNAAPFSQAQEPFLSQAEFKNGKLNGVWTIFDRRQRQLSRLTFEKGLRHGPAMLWLPSGQALKQMSYHQGALDGDVMEVANEGKLVKSGTFQRGRRIAKKVTHFQGSRNRQTEAVYLFAPLVASRNDDFWNAQFAAYQPVGKDERHGSWQTWYRNGQLQVEGHYLHDKPTGEFTWWYPNGQKYAEGQYVDGKQQGMWIWWHANGQKWTRGEYVNGQQSGQWSSWKDDGTIDQQANYTGGPRMAPIAVAEQQDDSSGRTHR